MDSQYIGAKFYSKADLSIGWNLEKAEKIINAFDETNTEYKINNIEIISMNQSLMVSGA